MYNIHYSNIYQFALIKLYTLIELHSNIIMSAATAKIVTTIIYKLIVYKFHDNTYYYQ